MKQRVRFDAGKIAQDAGKKELFKIFSVLFN